MTNELTTVTQAVQRLDEIAASSVALTQQPASFGKLLSMAQAVSDLRAALTPEVMKPIMGLMNTPLGFMTDRQDKNNLYTVDEVREFAIEATLRGFYLVGNEVNMIAKRMYAAQAGCAGKLNRLGTITDLVLDYDLPHTVNDRGATIECRASWKQNGAAKSIKCTFPIKVNNGMGTDAIIGKAKRKLLARILEQVTGSTVPEGEVEPDLANMKQANTASDFKFSEPSAKSQPIEPKKQTADEFNFVKPTKPEKKPTPENNAMRKEVADYMAESRVSFDSFRRALADEKLVADADSIGSWDEVPMEVCKALVENSKLTSKIVKNYATK